MVDKEEFDDEEQTKRDEEDWNFDVATALEQHNQQQQQQEREFMMIWTSSESDDSEECDTVVDNTDHENYDHYVTSAELDALAEEDSDYNSQDMEEDDIDPDELSYEDLIALAEIVGCESKGLLPNELNCYLRPYTYQNCCYSQCKYEFKQCVICQVEYEEEEAVVALPCEHAYHPQCITQWLQINKVCPICNADVSSSQSLPTTFSKTT